MIQIQDIHFAYHQAPILKGMTMSFKKGGFSTIVGPNGSGKSTLMSLLTKNHQGYRGSIEVNGKAIDDFSIENFAKTAAVINQNELIKFPFSCMEVILMGRKPHVGRFGQYGDHDFELVHEMMTLTNTIQFLDTPITEISGGEYQRVMLARALVQEPEILFLDEAMSAMDLSYKLHFLKLIRILVAEKKMTVVAVMHDLNLAYRFSDHVCVLHEGTLKSQGCPHTTLTVDMIRHVFGVESEYVPEKGFLFF